MGRKLNNWKKIGGEWHQLVGSYDKKSEANSNQRMWKGVGYKAKIQKGKKEKKTKHRVYIRNDKMRLYNHKDSEYITL